MFLFIVSLQIPPKKHNGARLIYIPLKANGWQSIAYDIISLAYSIF